MNIGSLGDYTSALFEGVQPDHLRMQHKVLSDDCEIEYGEIEQGSDNPNACFVVPGSFSTAQSWDKTAESLMWHMGGNQFGKLVCVTPFGMGKSKVNGHRCHFDVADAYSKLINEVFPPDGKITVIAHSKADWEALMLCMYHLKERVKGLVLSSPVMLSKKSAFNMLFTLIGNYPRNGDTRLVDQLRSIREAFRVSLSGLKFQLDGFKEMRDINLRGDIREIDFPVLVVGGECDIESVDQYHECARLFRHGEAHIVKGATHQFAHYNSDAFARVVKDWMDAI